MVPGDVVEPENDAILLLPLLALVATVSVPAKTPAEVGEKNINVADLLSANEAPAHVSELRGKGVAAVTVTVVMFRFDVPPGFSTVKVCELVLPTFVSGKLYVAGVISAVTDPLVTPVPVKDTILLVPLVALVKTVRTAADAVAAVGK